VIRTIISTAALGIAALAVSGLAQHSPLDPTQTVVMSTWPRPPDSI